MKILALFISLYSFSTFACRCMFIPAKNLANSEAIFEGEVLFSESNKTLVQVTKVLSTTVKLDLDYIGEWFVFSGTQSYGSCPGNDVTAKVGETIMFFPLLETFDDYVKTVVTTSQSIHHCGSFNNYLKSDGHRYKEVIDLIK